MNTTAITFAPGEVSIYYAARVPQLKQRRAAEWRGPCPVHHGADNNFAVNAATGEAYCHSQCGCGWDILALEQTLTCTDFKAAKAEVFRIVGRAESSNANNGWPGSPRITANYDYTDETGKLLYQVCRCEPKRFLQRYPNAMGGWSWKKYPDQVLYHLPEVLENPIIFVVEGERDAETLREYGFVATTNAGGANAPWLPQFTDALRAREVILIPDNDYPGRQRVLRIARALKGNVLRRTILTLEGPGIKDVSDWFPAGHSEVELIDMLDGEEISR